MPAAARESRNRTRIQALGISSRRSGGAAVLLSGNNEVSAMLRRSSYVARLLPFRAEIGLAVSLFGVFAVTAMPLG
jgi:hypothetical protein